VHIVRARHSSSELGPEVVYEGPVETEAREATERYLDMLRSEYADTAERAGGTLRATVKYASGHGRPGFRMRARISVSGTDQDAWSRVLWIRSA
jgi:hypothetical protein